jgi:hypothetical protein
MRIPPALSACLIVGTELLIPRQTAGQCLSDNRNEVADLKRDSDQHEVIGKFPAAFNSSSEYRVRSDSEQAQYDERWQAKHEPCDKTDRRTASKNNDQAAPPMSNGA